MTIIKIYHTVHMMIKNQYLKDDGKKKNRMVKEKHLQKTHKENPCHQTNRLKEIHPPKKFLPWSLSLFFFGSFGPTRLEVFVQKGTSADSGNKKTRARKRPRFEEEVFFWNPKHRGLFLAPCGNKMATKILDKKSLSSQNFMWMSYLFTNKQLEKTWENNLHQKHDGSTVVPPQTCHELVWGVVVPMGRWSVSMPGRDQQNTWMSRKGSERISGLLHLFINGIHWGYNPLILTFDPNFLGHPSGPTWNTKHLFEID